MSVLTYSATILVKTEANADYRRWMVDKVA